MPSSMGISSKTSLCELSSVSPRKWGVFKHPYVAWNLILDLSRRKNFRLIRRYPKASPPPVANFAREHRISSSATFPYQSEFWGLLGPYSRLRDVAETGANP